MGNIKIIIVDDNLLIRNGLIVELNKIDEVEIIGVATNGKEFLELLSGKKPDLIFMDVNMPILDGYEATNIALSINPLLKIIAISTSCNESSLKRMIKAGAKGYILKNIDSIELRLCINYIMKGKNYFSVDISPFFTDNYFFKGKKEIDVFTSRELDILNLIGKGYNTKEIAKCLQISSRTVESHKANMQSKTESRNVLNLLIYGIKHDLIDISSK